MKQNFQMQPSFNLFYFLNCIWTWLDIFLNNLSDTRGKCVPFTFKYMLHKVQLHSFISFMIQSYFIEILSVFLCHSSCQAYSNSWDERLKEKWLNRILTRDGQISDGLFHIVKQTTWIHHSFEQFIQALMETSFWFRSGTQTCRAEGVSSCVE